MTNGADVLTRFNLRPPLLSVIRTLEMPLLNRQMLIKRCLDYIRSSTYIIRPFKIARNNGDVREYAIRLDKGAVEDREWLR